MSAQIEIVEMSIRDGFQNEIFFVATANKLELIRRAINAGLKRIEVTWFVNSKRAPLMENTEGLARLLPKHDDGKHTQLMLNCRSFERDRDLKFDEIGCAVVATETINKRNQGVEIIETIQ